MSLSRTNLNKIVFQNNTYRAMTVAVLAMGLSLPVYAATSESEAGELTPNVVSQTTKVVTTTTTTHVAKHKARHAQSKSSKTTEVQQDSTNLEKKVIIKNGVIFNDVEPTGQSPSTPFGVPTSTSDTLQGGVTSTVTLAPTQ